MITRRNESVRLDWMNSFIETGPCRAFPMLCRSNTYILFERVSRLVYSSDAVKSHDGFINPNYIVSLIFMCISTYVFLRHNICSHLTYCRTGD
jgi:hypothetical protein